MRQRRRISLWIGILALLALGASLFWTREPRCGGKSLSYWVAELKNSNADRAHKSQQALHEIGPPAIPFLLKKLRNANSLPRRWYGELWNWLPDIMRHKIWQPQDNDQLVNAVTQALRQLGPSAGPALMKALEDKDGLVQRAAAWSFPYGQENVPWLLKILKTPDYDNRQAAVAILGNLGSKATPAVPALAGVMRRDKIEYIRETAARSLAELGPVAANAVPELKAAAGDPNVNVRIWSAIALWRIDHDPNTILTLTAELRATNDPGICRVIVMVLGEAGPLAKSAVPVIRAKLAAFGPGGTQAAGEDAMPLLIETAGALRRIDPPQAEDAIHQLRTLLGDSSAYIREEAAFALWHIDRDTNLAKFWMKELENAPDPAVRTSILEHLREIGSPANALMAPVSNGTRRRASNDVRRISPVE